MRIPHQAEGFIPALKIYNTLSREKVDFQPLNPPFVGIYLCGPTVYNLAHIGNARPAIFFDVVRRYLAYLGYKVRFVRNITDVGHLTGDSDDGEDKISKQAKLEQIEPMEIVNYYTQKYHEVIDKLNVMRPSIEPTATGHIVEQIELVQKIIDQGFAYISEGSVYFDVNAYRLKENYGELSGRILEDLLETTRELEGQNEKRNTADFALWKKANPEHLMRWQSPWGDGFPGWHLECTAMSTKYLGKVFDIHGGGLDLMFPHHECEIAQSKAAYGEAPVKYWMHNNMVTVNGTKMGKSLGNFITIEDLFSGKNKLLERSYSPMTVRFFILQAHYRSTLDFSNDALLAAQKAYKRIINAMNILKKLEYPLHPKGEIDEKNDEQIQNFCDTMLKGMQDDFNTAIVIAQLSNLVKKINAFYINPETLDTIQQGTFERMKALYNTMIKDILGLEEEKSSNNDTFIEALLDLYVEAKEKKEYTTVDKIRTSFKNNNLIIKDLKKGVDWAYQE